MKPRKWWQNEKATVTEITEKVETPFSDSKVYKPEDVARLLKVKRSTVYDWVKKRGLKALRLPSAMRIQGKHINEFLWRLQVGK